MNEPWTKKWSAVDSLLTKESRPEAALILVDELYQQAETEKQEAIVIKALLYRQHIERNITEYSFQKQYEEWVALLPLAFSTAQRAIINCQLAAILRTYYSQNSWRLYNRSETVAFVKDDISTWSIGDFQKTILQYYQAVFQDEDILTNVSLDSYEPIIIKGGKRQLRPYLFDLLAHDMLDFLKAGEINNTEPAYMFTMDDPAILQPAPVFMNMSFQSADSTNTRLLALKLFQRIMKVHAKDKNPNAFISVDIERINWCFETCIAEDKDDFYTSALMQITTTYPDATETKLAWYYLAAHAVRKAASYHPLDDTAHRYEKIKALNIIQTNIDNLDSTNEGQVRLYNLLQEIEKPTIGLQAEEVNLPGDPFRLMVNYKNITQLYLRVVRIVDEEQSSLNRWEDDYWQKIMAYPAYKQWQQVLPDTKDMQEHSVEIKVDALPPGTYLIMASTGKEFDLTLNTICAIHTDVSRISYFNTGKNYFVVDRHTGQPIEHAQVSIFTQEWIPSIRKRENILVSKIFTDVNGYFELPVGDRNYNAYVLTFKKDNDSLTERSAAYYHAYQHPTLASVKDIEERTSFYFFTDRAIYRPGQTVFFKAIGITKDTALEKSTPLSWKEKILVSLLDVNSQVVDSMRLSVNEYGSVFGSFKLPTKMLTGVFTLQTAHFGGSISCRVEEYKRPGFYILFDTIKTEARLGDTVHISGIVKGYAGNNIDNALLEFDVSRNSRLMYDWAWYRRPGNIGNRRVIKHGSLQTDVNGRFEFSFVAHKDGTIQQAFDPVFDFSIDVNVTDISGETRQETMTIELGYTSLLLHSDLREKTAIRPAMSNEIITTNLQGQQVSTAVLVNIYSVQSPNRLIRKRYWQRPDQFVMSEKEYINHFPYDEYDNETHFLSWKKNELVKTVSLSAEQDKKFFWPEHLKPGYYLVEVIARDKAGEIVTIKKPVLLYMEQEKNLPVKEYHLPLEISETKDGISKTCLVGTSLRDIYLTIQSAFLLPERKETDVLSFRKVSRRKQNLRFELIAPANAGVQAYAFVKHNRMYTKSTAVVRPDTGKNIRIEIASHRNKTEPGSNEHWKIAVKGRENELAELMSSLYDASLDAFVPHSWVIPPIRPMNDISRAFNTSAGFNAVSGDLIYKAEHFLPYPFFYDRLVKDAGAYLYDEYGISDMEYGRFSPRLNQSGFDGNLLSAAPAEAVPSEGSNVAAKTASEELLDQSHDSKKPVQIPTAKSIRKNFQETAFFYPAVYADTDGMYHFEFTIPESLTTWKWLLFAHNKDLAMAYHEAGVVTQKEMMVQAQLPRFMREGDKMQLAVKVTNLSDHELTGSMYLSITDGLTLEPLDGLFQNSMSQQYFTVSAGQSSIVHFPVVIPFGATHPVVIKARGEVSGENMNITLSDGEEHLLPVLSNRMMVTESMPLYARGSVSKEYRFEKLLQPPSPSLTHQSLTVEYTANPAWYVVQALPFMDRQSTPCTESIFNSLYVNSLTRYVIEQNPTIQNTLNEWRKADTGFLQSNLERNQELKKLVLAETPWVLEAIGESAQRKLIADMADAPHLQEMTTMLLEKLKESQLPNGAFSWVKGGNEDRYITQYILTGIGKLVSLGIVNSESEFTLREIAAQGLRYLEASLKNDYNRLVESKVDMQQNQIGSIQLHYLYMRSFFIPEKDSGKAFQFYYDQAKKFWAGQSVYNKALIAFTLYRAGEKDWVLKKIIPSLIENAVKDNERGMYYKQQSWSGYWYEHPVEQQSLVINLFNELARQESVNTYLPYANLMQVWLIRNKQTNHWKTTKATADACFALISSPPSILSVTSDVEINLGDILMKIPADNGAGYLKQTLDGVKIKADMGNIKLTVKNEQHKNVMTAPSYGAVYWQYYEDLDKITPAATPLSIRKNLFVERNTDAGKRIELLEEGNPLHIGEKVIVRIELRSDRDMEYLHLNDMRAAGLEPIDVLSSYKWQDGLTYYESVKDKSTDFFISYFPKGTYVFEYAVRVTQLGDFSNGTASIQCYYAPEFISHSRGIRVRVEE